MTKPFLLFDLGETLVDLKDLLLSLAEEIASKHATLRPDVGEIVREWIITSSREMPRAPGQAFVPEFEIASAVMARILLGHGVRIGVSEAGQILRDGWDDFETRVRFVGGVTEEWLAVIRGLSEGMAIVTDGDRENVDRLLRRLPLAPYFDVIVTSEDVRAYKPNPEMYQAALRSLHASPARSIFVSDSPLDLHGAAALGMATCLFNRQLVESPGDLPPGSLLLSDPRGLVEPLRRFASTGRLHASD